MGESWMMFILLMKDHIGPRVARTLCQGNMMRFLAKLEQDMTETNDKRGGGGAAVIRSCCCRCPLRPASCPCHLLPGPLLCFTLRRLLLHDAAPMMQVIFEVHIKELIAGSPTCTSTSTITSLAHGLLHFFLMMVAAAHKPKTVIAFQWVKLDDVKLAHERLAGLNQIGPTAVRNLPNLPMQHDEFLRQVRARHDETNKKHGGGAGHLELLPASTKRPPAPCLLHSHVNYFKMQEIFEVHIKELIAGSLTCASTSNITSLADVLLPDDGRRRSQPKTAIVFQRVKMDDVKLPDETLAG